METSNPQEMMAAWTRQIYSPEVLQAWFAQRQIVPPLPGAPDPADFPLTLDSAAMAALQRQYMEELSGLWQTLVAAKPLQARDKRFTSPAWQESALHAFQAAAYLLNTRFLISMAETVEAPPAVKKKLRFTLQQLAEAMSPCNFLASNPEAQREILQTQGESLVRGIAHMLADLRKGRISQSDESAFEVGRNVATSEGAVVFENHLFQLIQYRATTPTVHERPLLIVPPCINKFYILDLQPANSLVRYAVEQGNTVFLISWRNPDASLTRVGWGDYIEDAVIQAIDVVRAITRQDQINTLGFCVGGTLLATALAVMYGRGERPASSVTLLTTMLDFSDTGVLAVYIDENQVSQRERDIGIKGLMPGGDFAAAFSSLRPSDLIWNYVESRYLKGQEPAAFDLLYWNADSTNLPGPMFCWYLRNLYLENSLKEPGRLKVAGQPLDLGRIAAPAFIFASREDHIVPWGTAYATLGLINRDQPSRNRFILGASGHIAGVINPPEKNRRSYWKLTSGKLTSEKPSSEATGLDAQDWLAAASEQPGSWWPEWAQFLSAHGGAQRKAPGKYGNRSYQPIEPAPGRYVKVRV